MILAQKYRTMKFFTSDDSPGRVRAEADDQESLHSSSKNDKDLRMHDHH